MNNKEIWKDIKGYENMYKVSNFGNVRSLNRLSRNRVGVVKLKGKPLKQSIDPHGYYKVQLCKNNVAKTFKIHKLVAITFLGHIPCGLKKIIDHINNDKSDNRLVNLQETTQRENMSKDRKCGTSKYTGVSWCKYMSKWKAGISIKRKHIHLGYFNDEIKASESYNNKLKQM